jgi:hypothetical protein
MNSKATLLERNSISLTKRCRTTLAGVLAPLLRPCLISVVLGVANYFRQQLFYIGLTNSATSTSDATSTTVATSTTGTTITARLMLQVLPALLVLVPLVLVLLVLLVLRLP